MTGGFVPAVTLGSYECGIAPSGGSHYLLITKTFEEIETAAKKLPPREEELVARLLLD